MNDTEYRGLRKNIKYCGNCNPEVHPKYVRHVAERIFKNTDPDTIVLINGCTRACLKESKNIESAKKVISVKASDIVRKDIRRNKRRHNGIQG